MSGLLARRAKKAVAGGAFAPTDIANLSGWWDASDGTTFTYSSGTLVSQWDDKSGTGNHMVQSNTANQPSRSITVNSLDALDFDGTNDRLQVLSTQFVASTTGAFSVFAVVVADVVSGDRMIVNQDKVSGTRGAQNLRASGTAAQSIPFTGTATAVVEAAGVTLSTATTYLFASVANATNVELWVNGSSNGATSTGANLTVTSDPFRIGASGHVTEGGIQNFWNGAICEVVIYAASLSAGNRGDVETYLNDKWGI